MERSFEDGTIRKVTLRLIPFLCLLYIVSFVDRINVGFAALSMSKDIGLTPATFGFGAGIFFLSYFVFEIPSNLILHHVGARRWISRVLITWGIVSAGSALISDAHEFYLVRFLLGAAEAGFFPGVILYLTYWFPKQWRGRVTAGFVVAIPLASFIAAPLSGLLLGLNGLAGLTGWQWMFILEAAPAVLLGVVCLFFLTDRPEQAAWLTASERDWLTDRLRIESGDAPDHRLGAVLRSLLNGSTLRLALIYFGLTTGLYGIELWLPQIIKGFGLSNLTVGFVGALPYLAAICTMGLWARRSDLSGDRFGSVAIACAAGCAGLVVAAIFHADPVLSVLFLSLAIAGVMAARPPFWAMAGEYFSGREAAAGIAAINATGNLGGFFGPTLIGWTREATGSFTLGLMISLFGASLFTLSLKRRTHEVL
jgi:ACS family tartrate transporter-like MFS transporter